LEPFTVTCSNLIQAYNAIRKNQELVETLEQRVLERTRELQHANASLEEANRRVLRASQAQLEQFAQITHEIRTPLNCIIGLSSLLQETELNPYQQDCLQMIVTSGDLLLTVVNDVLDYSKLESGNVEISIRPSNLQTCLDAVVHSIGQKARSKNLTVQTHYAPNVPETIEMDNRRLQQVLYNLLGNSVKFSKNDGAIELKVSVLDSPYQDYDGPKEDPASSRDDSSHGEASFNGEEPSDISTQSGGMEVDPTTARDNRGRDQDEEMKSQDDNPVPKDDIIDKDPSKSNGKKKLETCNRAASSSEPPDRCPFLAGDTAPNTSMGEDSMKDCDEEASSSEPPGVCPFLPVDKPPQNKQPSLIAERTEPRYNASDSDIDIGVHEEDTPIPDNLRRCSKILRFTVKDYGPGIRQKHFKRIFKAFKQATYYTETNYGGTGLGLAIVTKLVAGLGGSISVDSVVGEWTEFTVDLPFAGQQQPFDVEPLANELRQATIVSVEEESSSVTNGRGDVLEALGLQVQRFHNMTALLNHVSQQNSSLKDGCYLTLVDEKLYDATAYTRFSQVVKKRTALITHGPGYTVKETNLHLRSLRQVLPSMLIRSLVKHMKAYRSMGIEAPSPEVTRQVSYDRLRILIAEDNIINQKVLGRMLSRLGVSNVEFADNGQIAVTKNERQTFDIVFMVKGLNKMTSLSHNNLLRFSYIFRILLSKDMQMPVMDGLEATRLIVKQRGDNPLPKVIFVTANVSDKFEEEATDAGGDGYIAKPFSLGVIEKAFSMHL
jgi:signal transduction histidine kinase/CheY-like chemotaxis protein